MDDFVALVARLVRDDRTSDQARLPAKFKHII